MAIDFKFIKFTNYGTDFLKGKLFLNPLEYYRGIERIIAGESRSRNKAINDYREGSVASVNKDDLCAFGLKWGDEIKKALIGNVHLLSEDLNYLKVFCLYTLFFDDDEKVMILPSEKIYQIESKYAVIINDIEKFRQRISACLDKNRGKNGIAAFNARFVDYYGDDEKTKLLGAFHKTKDFWWQHEFRMAFPELTPDLEPTILEIGSISDIATMVTTDELMKNPQSIFPEYKFVSEIVD